MYHEPPLIIVPSPSIRRSESTDSARMGWSRRRGLSGTSSSEISIADDGPPVTDELGHGIVLGIRMRRIRPRDGTNRGPDAVWKCGEGGRVIVDYLMVVLSITCVLKEVHLPPERHPQPSSHPILCIVILNDDPALFYFLLRSPFAVLRHLNDLATSIQGAVPVGDPDQDGDSIFPARDPTAYRQPTPVTATMQRA